MPRILLAAPVLAALVSCGSAPEPTTRKDPATPLAADGKATPPTGEPVTPEPATDPAGSDPCGAAALGLGPAAALAPWTPPPGCSPRGAGQAILRSDDELAPRLECTAGMNHLVDFTRHALLVVGYTLSPAGAGVGAFDDGKIITLVTRQRTPCPGDPMPMPMNTAAWYLLPVGAERSFADKTCTIASKCN
jgi:hypothetical protein